MTDISVTAANVVAATGASIQAGTAGATITAGQAVYYDSSDGKYKLADCDSATAAARSVRGIALNGASDGQPIDILRSGDLDIGATLTIGEIYVLSTTAGGVAPFSDLESDDYVSILGVATAADNLKVQILNSGAQVQ